MINRSLLSVCILLGMFLTACSAAEGDVETASPQPTAITTTGRPTSTRSSTSTTTTQQPLVFDGNSAYEHLLAQMALGPRWPGSPGHAATGDYIIERLSEMGWTTQEQDFEYRSVQARNIIGRANHDAGPVVIIGAHYDTRKIADQTPGSDQPVPGAVDGASGVAVLLELARTLDLDDVDHEIWLAFFDVEDNGGGAMPDFEWIAGSGYMADNLSIVPEAMVLVDMIGDSDQQLYYEGNSDPELSAQLWNIAAELGFRDSFIPEIRYHMIDDHVPFAQKGIPAVDIIDFDYPYWHTVEDTADKASPESLFRVGRTLEVWLEDRLPE